MTRPNAQSADGIPRIRLRFAGGRAAVCAQRWRRLRRRGARRDEDIRDGGRRCGWGECAGWGDGGRLQQRSASSTAPSGSATSTAASSSAASSSAQAQPADYTELLIKATDIDAPEEFTASPPMQNPNGKAGVATSFSNPDGTHVIGDTILVLPDPSAAASALDAAKTALGGSVSGTPGPADVGSGGTTVSGNSPDGSKSVTVLLFTQGRAFTTLEFDGPPMPLCRRISSPTSAKSRSRPSRTDSPTKPPSSGGKVMPDDRCVDEGLRRTIATIAAFAGKFQQESCLGRS